MCRRRRSGLRGGDGVMHERFDVAVDRVELFAVVGFELAAKQDDRVVQRELASPAPRSRYR